MRSRSFLVIALVTLLAACNGSATASPSPSAAPTPGASAAAAVTPTPAGSAAASSAPSGAPGASPSASASAAASPGETMVVRTYFVLGGEPGTVGLLPIVRTVPKSAALANAAMEALLAGPTATESGDRHITTEIPAGTHVLALDIKGGVATIDLSSEFGADATTASVGFRRAQVAYTLTQFSTAKSVVITIAGAAAGGPVGRADFYGQLPAIFVDRPAYLAAAGDPARVTGNANVFEATFRVAILDAAGKSLVDQQVTATCGTGCRGTFDTTLAYTVSKAQYGTLRAYDRLAKDGTPENVRDYVVWLTPAG